MARSSEDFTEQNPPRVIRKIAVVGGFKGFENDPESNDYKMVMPALDYLRRSGIAIAEKPEFDAINFADKRNFLNEDGEYDMVFIAHVPNGRNLSWTRMSFASFSEWTDVTHPEKLANTIDSQNSPDRWAKRVKETGAALVASVGTYIEVGANYLGESKNFSDFKTLVTPLNDSTIVGRAGIFETDNMQLVYGRPLDLPYQWLSIAVQADKIKSFIKSPSDTVLGKELTPEDNKVFNQARRLQF